MAISVRPDDEAERALQALEASGPSRSEVIRSALVDSARRPQRGSELAAEVAALEADPADRDGMAAISTSSAATAVGGDSLPWIAIVGCSGSRSVPERLLPIELLVGLLDARSVGVADWLA
jgi:Arc/MetJ-type ribon-helix-helix transcriptional regulator